MNYVRRERRGHIIRILAQAFGVWLSGLANKLSRTAGRLWKGSEDIQMRVGPMACGAPLPPRRALSRGTSHSP